MRTVVSEHILPNKTAGGGWGGATIFCGGERKRRLTDEKKQGKLTKNGEI
jgi:hypothetical protein